MTTRTVTAEGSPGSDELQGAFETHRRELTGYCYRMLGSGFEAEDAVQETMVRAWKSYDRFEGRSSLRSWLYRIATNVCLDMVKGPQRRARPMDLGPSATAGSDLGAPRPEHAWVQPVPDAMVLAGEGDPAEVAAGRDSIRLAFVAALQHLPARQRAVLILREVLRWPATEVAELLDTTVASINSALQRARATIAATDVEASRPPTDAEQAALLARYVDAFERYDMSALVALLRDDAVMSMPPFPLWIEGPDEIAAFMVGTGAHCKGSRLIAVAGSGGPAFGSYKPADDGTFEPWAVQILELDADGRIAGYHHFIGPEIFALFGLPASLPAA